MSQITSHVNELSKKSISSVGVLHLRHMQSIDELNRISNIFSVGTILVSESFQGTIASIPMHSVGGIISIPDGSKVKQINGTLKIAGDFLHNANGDDSDILLVSGDLIITSPITTIGYKQLIISGQLYVPKGSEQILSTVVSHVTGQIIYYNHHHRPRIFMGRDRFGKDFFTYLKEPITMILMGEFEIESDVGVELLQEKIPEIILMGVLKTDDKKLLPLLQALTESKMGDIILTSHLNGSSL